MSSVYRDCTRKIAEFLAVDSRSASNIMENMVDLEEAYFNTSEKDIRYADPSDVHIYRLKNADYDVDRVTTGSRMNEISDLMDQTRAKIPQEWEIVRVTDPGRLESGEVSFEDVKIVMKADYDEAVRVQTLQREEQDSGTLHLTGWLEREYWEEIEGKIRG